MGSNGKVSKQKETLRCLKRKEKLEKHCESILSKRERNQKKRYEQANPFYVLVISTESQYKELITYGIVPALDFDASRYNFINDYYDAVDKIPEKVEKGRLDLLVIQYDNTKQQEIKDAIDWIEILKENYNINTCLVYDKTPDNYSKTRQIEAQNIGELVDFLKKQREVKTGVKYLNSSPNSS